MEFKKYTYYFIKRNGCEKYLNIYGNSFTGVTQPIKLWEKVPGDNMQKWIFKKDPTSESTCIRTACNTQMAINVYDAENDPRCTIYHAYESDSSNAYKNDCLVRVSEYTSGLYYIYLPAHGLYLTANGTSNGTQVTWESKLSYASNTQLWKFEEIETEISSITPPATTGILAKYTSPISNKNGLITVHNIPDSAQSSNNYVEANCEMNAGSMIPDGTYFDDENNITVSNIKSAINALITNVYPSGTEISDMHKYYYLFGEKRYATPNSVCHNGVDISGPDLAKLKALYGGEVINGGPSRSIFSIYNSDMGVTFNYVHMADHQFTVGDIVAAGEFIGRQSNVGDAVSSHLHFEVTEGSTIANPDTENVNTNMASILPYGYMFG